MRYSIVQVEIRDEMKYYRMTPDLICSQSHARLPSPISICQGHLSIYQYLTKQTWQTTEHPHSIM